MLLAIVAQPTTVLAMADEPRTLDYATPRRNTVTPLTWARGIVVLVGILLPYFARLPGLPFRGAAWLTDYLGDGPASFLFFNGVNVCVWGTILIGSLALRSLPAIALFATIGLAYPFYQHMRLDLRADAQAAIGLMFIPIYSVPCLLAGWVLGLLVDLFWIDGPKRPPRS